MNKIKKVIEKLNNKIINIFQNPEIDLKEVIEKFEYIHNQLPKDMKIVSSSLMNRGWFKFDIFSPEEGLINKSNAQQDKYMKDYITSNMNLIKNTLIDNHPNRKQQILDAFKAHKNKLYFCSIPTFLAIAEGLGRDLCNVGIFDKQNRLPKTRNLLNKIEPDDFIRPWFTPLDETSEITKTIISPTGEERTLLNRHLIMHGISDKYGSEINSLKSISLIYYIHNSLHFLNSEC